MQALHSLLQISDGGLHSLLDRVLLENFFEAFLTRLHIFLLRLFYSFDGLLICLFHLEFLLLKLRAILLDLIIFLAVHVHDLDGTFTGLLVHIKRLYGAILQFVFFLKHADHNPQMFQLFLIIFDYILISLAL